MEKRTAVSFALVMTTLLWSSNAARADIRQLEENPSAQPQSELLLTNTTDVVGLYLEGYNFPVGSWVWAPGTGMIPVLFQPMTIVWANTANLPTGLAGITNSVPTSLQGVNAFPLWVTLWPQSNTVTVLQPWSDVTLTEFPVPDWFPSWQVYEANLYPSCIISGINYTNWETLVEEGYTQFSVPLVITHAWLMDVGSRDTYWNNLEAQCEAAQTATASAASMSGGFMPMDDDDDGGGDPCLITNLTQPFYVTSITQGTNGTTITWQSCPNMIYFVLSAETLQSNTYWAWRSLPMWGQNGSTIWTDSMTTNGSGITSMFYKVGRRPPPIAASGNHSLAILTNGTLWAWGKDDQGQLGDGGNSVQVTPELIAGPLCGPANLTNPVALAAGYDFSVAVDATGVVWTWGDGGSGQLGNGATINALTPAPINGISDVVSVAAGDKHTLALRADGTVWAWGNDSDFSSRNDPLPGGVLGAGNLSPVTSTNVPIRSLIPTGTVIVAIAAGNYWSLALDTTGQIWGWGDNGAGQIGTSVNTGVTNLPTLVPGISSVIAIAAGLGHSIAVRADNTLWTWGDNADGELGRSGITTNPGQVVASGLSNNVVAIAGGNEFTLAVTSSGQIYAWGDNSYGELGAIGSGSTPILVSGISDAVSVSANHDGHHSLAVTLNQGTNQYYGWGYDGYGQVGNGLQAYYGYSLPAQDQYTPAQLPFCDACASCVQLGSSGSFTAQCTGTLRLYFNDDYEYEDNGGSYTVTVTGLVNNVTVAAIASNGVAVGIVSNGVSILLRQWVLHLCQWELFL